MKTVAIFVILVGAVFAAPPQNPDALATNLRYENENIGIDGYKYAYETSNNIQAEQQGELKNAGKEDASIVVRGQYSFVADDGKTYKRSYVADENGYRSETSHSGIQGRGSTIPKI